LVPPKLTASDTGSECHRPKCRNVAAERGNSVPDSCTIKVNSQTERMCDVAQGPNFIDGIQGSHLGGLRNRHDAWLHVVHVAERVHQAADLLR